MADRLRPPVEINLGGKSLNRILYLLGEQGWKINQNALKSVDLRTIMRHGDRQGAEFWHDPKATIVDGYVVIRKAHVDYLTYKGGLLLRDCSTDGKETVSSAVVQG